LTGITVKNDLGEIIRTAEYTYDVYNQRIAKTVDADGDGSLAAVTERFVYGSDQNIALVFDENGNVNHRYLFGNGVDQIEADESNGNTRWALTDHLGSVRDVVDDSGTVLNHFVYDAFGGVTSQTDESVVFRYGYTARELDAESGLQYNRARYLDSFTGKFISQDPISFQGGDSNLYRYVFNSPLNGTDPTGHLVVANYSISRQALTVVDLDSGRSATVKAFSGYGPFQNRVEFENVSQMGPIPVGVYDIVHFTPNPNWYRLDRRDNQPLNDQYDDNSLAPSFPRGQFRLHAGSISLGCVTVPKGNVEDWSTIQSIINATTHGIVEDRVSYAPGVYNGVRRFVLGKKTSSNPVLLYGTLFVNP
jgi:RHS repeat-associated protein